jgi:hypothetical protein
VSADQGMTWRWLFRDADGAASYTNARLRCPGVSQTYSTTNFPAIAVDPAQPTEHILLGGWGAAAQGLTALRDGKWKYWNACGAPTQASNSGNINISKDANSTQGCFEGLRPNTFQVDGNMYVIALGVVSWNTTERRVITNGTVQTNSARAAAGGSNDLAQPLVYITGLRGAVRAAWDPVNHRFAFKQFGDTLVGSPQAQPPTWQTTGFGDTCVSDVVWPDGRDADSFVMAVSDGGLAATSDRGLRWKRTSELWPGALGESTSKGTAVTAGLGCVFAAHTDRGGTGVASVLSQCNGSTWRVIGGLQYSGTGDNGLSGAKYVRSLHVISPPSSTHSVRLLAAAERAFLVFDSTWSADSQWRNISLPELCGVGKAVVDLSAGVALTACGKSVYMLDLHSFQITRVEVNFTGVNSRGQPVVRALRPHQQLTTLLVWPADSDTAQSKSRTWNLALGTQYPPVVLAGVLTSSGSTAMAHVQQTFDPKLLYNSSAIASSIEYMTMTTIVRLPSGTIACGLFGE